MSVSRQVPLSRLFHILVSLASHRCLFPFSHFPSRPCFLFSPLSVLTILSPPQDRRAHDSCQKGWATQHANGIGKSFLSITFSRYLPLRHFLHLFALFFPFFLASRGACDVVLRSSGPPISTLGQGAKGICVYPYHSLPFLACLCLSLPLCVSLFEQTPSFFLFLPFPLFYSFPSLFRRSWSCPTCQIVMSGETSRCHQPFATRPLD